MHTTLPTNSVNYHSVVELQCAILQALEDNNDCLLSVSGIANQLNIPAVACELDEIQKILDKLHQNNEIHFLDKTGLCVPARWYAALSYTDCPLG